MSDDGRRRGLRGRRDAGAPTGPGATPRPNVLSDASPPNRLSTETSPNAGGPGGTQVSVTPASGPQVNSRGTMVTADGQVERPGVRLPGVSTLIFLGFVALTAFRIVGEWVEENVVPAPAATNAAAPGLVTFGTRATEDCAVIGAAVEFAEGADVWWSATMSTTQPPDAAVVVLVLRNGTQLTREDVPADESGGDWDLLCSSGPVGQDDAGKYRVEVWNEARTVLLAAGDYVIA